jgi:hypothetical protein
MGDTARLFHKPPLYYTGRTENEKIRGGDTDREQGDLTIHTRRSRKNYRLLSFDRDGPHRKLKHRGRTRTER